jgi:hypothetical protein
MTDRHDPRITLHRTLADLHTHMAIALLGDAPAELIEGLEKEIEDAQLCASFEQDLDDAAHELARMDAFLDEQIALEKAPKPSRPLVNHDDIEGWRETPMTREEVIAHVLACEEADRLADEEAARRSEDNGYDDQDEDYERAADARACGWWL